VQALLPRPVAPPLCRRQVGGGARDAPAPHNIYTRPAHAHAEHALLNAHNSPIPTNAHNSPIPTPMCDHPSEDLDLPANPPSQSQWWQVCYAKAVRAHARRGARREGGKERQRQPSGAAEGAKRERELEALSPEVRQHAERAVLVVPQLTSLASCGAGQLAAHSGGAVELLRAHSWRLRCAREAWPKSPILRFPTPSCGRASASADPSEGTTLLSGRRRRFRPQLQPRLRRKARLSSHRVMAARRAARDGCGHSPRRRCRHRRRCVRRRDTSCTWPSEAGRHAESAILASSLPPPCLSGLVPVAPDGAPHSG